MFHETRFTSRYPISWPAALLFRFSMTNQFGAVGYEQIVRVAASGGTALSLKSPPFSFYCPEACCAPTAPNLDQGRALIHDAAAARERRSFARRCFAGKVNVRIGGGSM